MRSQTNTVPEVFNAILGLGFHNAVLPDADLCRWMVTMRVVHWGCGLIPCIKQRASAKPHVDGAKEAIGAEEDEGDVPAATDAVQGCSQRAIQLRKHDRTAQLR
jgi:hypothetical protein